MSTSQSLRDSEVAIASFDIRYEFLRKHKIEHLWITSGIYFLFEDDEIIYIGQSDDILSRMCQHRKKISFDGYFWFECQKKIRSVVEANLILKFNPRHNNGIPQNELFKKAYNIKKIFRLKDVRLVKKFARENNITERRGYYNLLDFVKLGGLNQ